MWTHIKALALTVAIFAAFTYWLLEGPMSLLGVLFAVAIVMTITTVYGFCFALVDRRKP